MMMQVVYRGVRRSPAAFAALLVVLSGSLAPLRAQHAPPQHTQHGSELLSFERAPALQERTPSPWRPVRIAKWTLTFASAGTALYGFMQNREADDAYGTLEHMCQDNFARCRNRLPGGAYADPSMEAQYQRVRSLDGRARAALIAGQLGVATSVVLFIIDLRNQQGPPNIPYEPERLELAPSGDGGLSLRVRLPVR
jgi:hypothetical protein